MPDSIMLTLVGATVLFILLASLLSGELRLFRWLPDWAMRAGHFVTYTLFGFLLAVAIAPVFAAGWMRFGVAVLSASAFGALMELLQYFRPNRTPDRTDALINATGAAIGALGALVWTLP